MRAVFALILYVRKIFYNNRLFIILSCYKFVNLFHHRDLFFINITIHPNIVDNPAKEHNKKA